MKRSDHLAALTKALAAATARFQSHLRRLARTVFRDELARILVTAEPAPRPTVAEALRVEPVTSPRRSPAARPRKPAAAAAARKATPVRTSKAAAARRTSKPAAVTRTSKPAAARTSKAVAGTPEDAVVAIAEPELAAAVAHVEPATAGPHAELAAVAQSVRATTNEERPREARARARAEARAQRRQERQDNARSRRAAAGMRAESVASAATRAAAEAATRAEPVAAGVHEGVPGTDGTRAMGRRVKRGTVKWFSEAKGYGFIKADDGMDAFVHHSAISGDGVCILSEGQTVSYEEVEGPRGLLAVNVVPTALGTDARR